MIGRGFVMAMFGSYEVLETVAVGSTGTVYRARHREIERLAAIKELNASVLAVPGLVARFRAEAQTLASLDDEHVVAVFDFVEEPDRVWIAEQWVDGVTIAALLTASGRLSPEQGLGVLRGALLGLAHAHDRNLVHRDFSPGNILADQAGTSKLVDFGLAAPVGGTGVCGTPAFMSPEACRGAAVGKSSDVYSAAAVLYHLLSGRMPFPARTAEAVLHAHLAKAPPVLAGQGPVLAALVAQGMAKDPAARPADARAFLDMLEEAARERYGADWLARASIAGLVAAVGTGAATVAEGSSVGDASSAAGAAATVFTDAAATTGTAAATISRGAWRPRRPWLIAGAAAAVLAIAIPATFALTANTSRQPKSAPTNVALGASQSRSGASSGHGPSGSPASSSSSGSSTSSAATPGVCSLVTKAEAQSYLPPVRWVYLLKSLPANPATHFPAGSLCGYYPFPAGTTNLTAPFVVVILDKAKTTAGELKARMAALSPSPAPDPALDAVAYYQSDNSYKYLYAVKNGTGILVETRGLSITKAQLEQLAKRALARIP